MCGLDYVKKFQRAKEGEVLTTFKDLDSLLGLKPIASFPLKFMGRFTPMGIVDSIAGAAKYTLKHVIQLSTENCPLRFDGVFLSKVKHVITFNPV